MPTYPVTIEVEERTLLTYTREIEAAHPDAACAAGLALLDQDELGDPREEALGRDFSTATASIAGQAEATATPAAAQTDDAPLRIVIHVQGGAVRSVIAPSPVEYVLVDFDHDAPEHVTPHGDAAHLSVHAATVDAAEVHAYPAQP